LEEDMNKIAAGEKSRKDVVDLSRDILHDVLDELLPHQEEIKDALADAVAADAYVGPCPKCGKDLQLRASSKTRSMFIGCAGWPDCDVTYPLPKGKVEALEEKCPTCGMPQIKVTAFRSKPRTLCIDPNCPTNQEPDVVVGKCPTCAERDSIKSSSRARTPTLSASFVARITRSARPVIRCLSMAS
ncbi:MAG: topoisomerase DNA-binding C4 zinc finger domain-containing protein, partial [Slackia sp.]